MSLVEEIWKRVPDYPAYEVSTLGRVRSYWKRGTGGRGIMGICDTPKLLKGQLTPDKTMYIVTLGTGKGGGQKTFGVARLVLTVFIRPPNPGEVARHYDNPDPTDCRLDNLRWGTQVDNATDVVRHEGKHFNTGRKHSEEAKEKMSITRKGRKHTPEARARMTEAMLKSWARRQATSDSLPYESTPSVLFV